MPTPRRLERLVRLADKPERVILGLMSGTSLDGLDLALCRVRGHGPSTEAELLHFRTAAYSEVERARLRDVVARETVSLEDLTRLHGWLALRHAAMVREALAGWGVRAEAVDALASHGLTVYHAPAAGDVGAPALYATLQAGDGDRLAVGTGLLTVSDFRQKEIALGGQGAPLAPYAEALLFGAPGRGRLLLNVGGIANFTWLPGEDPVGGWISADTGPGNTLIDRAVRRYFPEKGEGFDRGGALAAAGAPDPALLAALKAHPYFRRPPPKSTGPETFGGAYLDDALRRADSPRLVGQDVVATLTRLTAETAAEAIRAAVPDLAGTEGYVSGGGARNATLMRWLAGALPGVRLADSAALGVPPEAKEAVLFAVLANETLAGAGVPDRYGGRPGGFALGKLSFPD